MFGRSTAIAFIFLVDHLLGLELVLKPSRDVFNAAVGSSMVISCTLSDVEEGPNTAYELHWIDKNNMEVTTKAGRVYIEDEGQYLKKLYVTSIGESDAGRYECRSRIANAWQTRSIELVVFESIAFVDAPSVQNPAVNTDALIMCKVSGKPVPEVDWLHENTRIQNGEKFVKETDGLRINGITEADNGNYTCRAEVKSEGRYDERRIEVVVHIPPKITQGLTAKEGVQGTDLAMSCQASGLPSPLYEFFKDNHSEPVVSSDRIHVENLTGNIYFSPLDKLDEGQYLCRASNGAGSDATVGELKVLVPPFIKSLDEILVSEGETAVIECRSHGDPVPELTFQWADDHAVQRDSNRTTMTNTEGGYLMVSISNVEPNDAGNFSCRAQNSVGTDEQTGGLKVLFQPRFVRNQTSVEYIWAGQRQNMTCGASAVPEPTIEWLRGGSALADNDTYHIYSLGGGISLLEIHVREIDQGWIYGPYVCRARNRLGEAEKTINLFRAAIPDAPKLVELVEAYPSAVFLRAIEPEEDGGMNVLGYRVEYNDSVNDFSLSEDIVIRNLKPSTTYEFKVRARNEVGLGRGVLIQVTTAALRQPYPIEITSEPEGKDSFGYAITWKAPIDGGLHITEYKFSYRKVSVEINSFNISQPLEDWIVLTPVDLPLNEYQLKDLQADSYYELEIRLYNSMGWSQPNKQFVFLTAKDLFATTSASTFTTTTLTLPPPSSQPPPQNPWLSLSAAVPETAVNGRLLPNIAAVTSDTPADPEHENLGQTQTANVTVPIVVVVIVICLIFLVIVDISCYFMNNCGLTKLICVHVCGREPRKFKAKGIEAGESDKKPLSDDALQQMEPLAASHSGDSDYKAVEQSHQLEERVPVNGAPDTRVRHKNASETDEC